MSTRATPNPHPLPDFDSTHSTTRRKRGQVNPMSSFLNDLHARNSSIPETPALKRIKVADMERVVQQNVPLLIISSLPVQPTLSTDYQGAYTPRPRIDPPPPPSSAPSITTLRRQFSYTPTTGRMDHSNIHRGTYLLS